MADSIYETPTAKDATTVSTVDNSKKNLKRSYDLPLQITSLLEKNQQAVQVFNASYDEEGVYFYQAYRKEIGEYAIKNQTFNPTKDIKTGETISCPFFSATRMTWIKPSFGWMLYRCGYGGKPRQEKVLKIKLSHEVVGEIMKYSRLSTEEGGAGGGSKKKGKNEARNSKKDDSDGDENTGNDSNHDDTTVQPDSTAVKDTGMTQTAKSGRIQWDPERDLFLPEDGKMEPRKMLRTRAIQIGMAGGLSEYYVNNIIKIEDVTELANQIGEIHAGMAGKNSPSKKAGEKASDSKERYSNLMKEMREVLPVEKGYLPCCNEGDLIKLGMMPGEPADWLSGIGRGHIGSKK